MPKVAVIEVTDENRAELVALTMSMSMYLGERCKYCLGEFKTLNDLKDAVWAGYHEHGRLAHDACWQAAHPQDAVGGGK